LPFKFNALLEAAAIDPRNVRLLRHRHACMDGDFEPYRLWRESYDDFVAYQSRQSARTEKIIGPARFWASFVVTPDEETLFVGIYGAAPKRPALFGAASAPRANRAGMEPVVYELEERAELSDLIAKLSIDWGGDVLPQVQRAETNDKQIIELRREAEEAKSPGYLSFMERLSGAATPGLHAWSAPGKPTKRMALGQSPGAGERGILSQALAPER
jgi:hypothetical protein